MSEARFDSLQRAEVWQDESYSGEQSKKDPQGSVIPVPWIYFMVIKSSQASEELQPCLHVQQPGFTSFQLAACKHWKHLLA